MNRFFDFRYLGGRFPALVLQLSFWCCLFSLSFALTKQQHRYCIIGAGPGGVQAAYYLEQFGLDYMVFERGPAPGSFFSRYPRHRKLISVNKVRTGSKDREFNLRFDWNSLITSHNPGTMGVENIEPVPPFLFRNYSAAYYPPADALVDYLADFAKHYRLKASYNVNVTLIERRHGLGNFLLHLKSAESQIEHVRECFVVILASGRYIPVKMRDPAVEAVVEGYESVTTMKESFEDQDVLLLGGGNAALETAESIVDYAASVHVAYRRPIRMAHQTHYVGHARSVNLDILDRYQLKLLDALLHGIDAQNLTYFRDPDRGNRIHCRIANPSPTNPCRKGYDRVIRCLGFLLDASIFSHSKGSTCSSKAGVGCDRDVDRVSPYLEPGQRFLEVASNFESVNVPRLFVAGTQMHFRDFKRSAGGFIHGFRYLTRTLTYRLREMYEGVAYPSVRGGPYPTVRELVEGLTQATASRLRNVSSLYQMFGQLSDVFLIDAPKGSNALSFRHLRDIPSDQITSRNYHGVVPKIMRRAQYIVAMTLVFGKYNQGSGTLRHHLEPETAFRTSEKIMWDDDSDPDLRLGRAFAPTTHVKRLSDGLDDLARNARLNFEASQKLKAIRDSRS